MSRNVDIKTQKFTTCPVSVLLLLFFIYYKLKVIMSQNSPNNRVIYKSNLEGNNSAISVP